MPYRKPRTKVEKVSKEEVLEVIKEKKLHKFGLDLFTLKRVALALAIVKKRFEWIYDSTNFIDKGDSIKLEDAPLYILKKPIDYKGPFFRGLKRFSIEEVK